MGTRILALIAALFFATCAPPGESVNQVRVLAGTIYVTGNEPFTRLALQAVDGRAYILKCEKDVEVMLDRSQGKKFTIRFSVIEYLAEGPVITVLSAKPVKE